MAASGRSPSFEVFETFDCIVCLGYSLAAAFSLLFGDLPAKGTKTYTLFRDGVFPMASGGKKISFPGVWRLVLQLYLWRKQSLSVMIKPRHGLMSPSPIKPSPNMNQRNNLLPKD